MNAGKERSSSFVRSGVRVTLMSESGSLKVDIVREGWRWRVVSLRRDDALRVVEMLRSLWCIRGGVVVVER